MNAAKSMKPSNRPRACEEIIELFQACAKKLGKTPGAPIFEKLSGVTASEVERHFWRGAFTELAETAGLACTIWMSSRGVNDRRSMRATSLFRQFSGGDRRMRSAVWDSK